MYETRTEPTPTIEVPVFHGPIKSGIKVSVHLYSQGQPVVITDVENTYQKGDMYCVRQYPNGTCYKFPLMHIFRVTEEA